MMDAADTTTAKGSTMRRALRHWRFRRLLAGLAVSQTGDWLYNVALIAVVYNRTHSADWVAATTAARVAPIVLLGPFGGVVADRFDRRTVMIASDVLRAVLMAALALTTLAGLPVVLVPVLAGLATAAATPYPPCVAATTPRLVPDAELAGANAARSAVGALSIMAGPALGGLLLLVAAPEASFLVNAATFVVSALLVVSLPATAPSTGNREDSETEMLRVIADIAAGFEALRRSAEAIRLVGADLLCSLVYGAQTVLLLLLAHDLGHGANGYGWLVAGMGLGGVVGTTVAARATDSRRPRPVIAAALLAVGLSLPLLTATSSLAVAVALTVVTGAGSIVVEVMTDTGLQRALDERVLGRAYGLALPAALAGIVVGSLVAAPLVSLFGLTGALLVLAALVCAYAVMVPQPVRRSSAAPGRNTSPGVGDAATACPDSRAT
jgi:MFS family permease